MTSELSPSAALILLDLCRKHLYAAQKNDHESRERLFRMVDDLRWAYPDAAKSVDDLYGEKA